MEKNFNIELKSIANKEFPTESNEYFVAMKDGSGGYIWDTASWKTTGEEVLLEKKDESDPMKPLSAEEKLIRAIFGNYLSVKIQKPGFYQITSDLGANTEHPECTQRLVECVADFWCEMPKLVGPDYTKEKEAVDIKAFLAKSSWNRSWQYLKKHAIAANLVYDLKINPTDDPLKTLQIPTCAGSIYTLTLHEYLELICSVDAVNEAFQAISKPEREFLKQQYLTIKDEESSRFFKQLREKMFNPVCREYHIRPELTLYLFRAVVDCDGNRYILRNHLAKGCNGDAAKALTTSTLLFHLPERIRRYGRIAEIGAPTIILMNELRIMVHYAIGSCKSKLTGYDEERFASNYGCLLDGTSYIDESANTSNTTPSSENANEEESTTAETSTATSKSAMQIGVDYPHIAVITSPDYLFFKGLYCLFDNATHQLIVDAKTNDVVVFKDTLTASNYKQKLYKQLGIEEHLISR